jgi:peptidoglycan/xylan/chitin deacetylase (PgdA/CDA1 family)
MHGGDNAPYTDEAITPIVQGLRAHGYELVTVTELMKV